MDVIKNGKVEQKPDTFGPAQFKKIAEFVFDTYETRKRNRAGKEKLWREVDRQIALIPNVQYKRGPGGKEYNHKRWMPELELPWQADTLEVLTSDVMRMVFPDTGPWFAVHSDIGDNTAGLQGTPNVSVLMQDALDQFVESWVYHSLSKFDYRGAWDLINMEALKYANGIGRVRYFTGLDGKKYPGLAPVSIKNTYLDDMETALLAEGARLTPGVVFRKTMKLADLQRAAILGLRENPDSGWMPDALKDLDAKNNGTIELIEFEGDIVIPDGTTSEIIEGFVATAVCGKKGDSKNYGLVRLRPKDGDETIINVAYHREDINSPYGTSPLMKGVPLQKVGSEAINRTMQAAILNTEPIINFNADDQFAKAGENHVEPGRKWFTQKRVDVLDIGRPAELFAIYQGIEAQYENLSGMSAPRMGAQTNSHTTAYAKDQEIERGTVRTVDFVRATLQGPVSKWLDTHYKMSKMALADGEERVWMTRSGQYEPVTNEALPQSKFEVFGAAGPQESLARMQMKREALISLIQVNQIGVASGTSTPLNIKAIEKYLLQQVGISESDAFTGTQAIPEGTPALSPMGGPPGNPGGTISTALQALAYSGR